MRVRTFDPPKDLVSFVEVIIAQNIEIVVTMPMANIPVLHRINDQNLQLQAALDAMSPKTTEPLENYNDRASSSKRPCPWPDALCDGEP